MQTKLEFVVERHRFLRKATERRKLGLGLCPALKGNRNPDQQVLAEEAVGLIPPQSLQSVAGWGERSWLCAEGCSWGCQ